MAADGEGVRRVAIDRNELLAQVGGDSRCPGGGLVGRPFVDCPDGGKITAWLGEVLAAAK